MNAPHNQKGLAMGSGLMNILTAILIAIGGWFVMDSKGLGQNSSLFYR